MCGIFGVVTPLSAPPLPERILRRAGTVQAHRGPDANGIARYEVASSRVVLGHQRLSIIDLSESANQPMSCSQDGSSLVFNGELYNYVELRRELEVGGEQFFSNSDTEVVLRALNVWGPELALSRFNWMGALAWLDRRHQRLLLIRDPAAEKPIYYCIEKGVLFFASEIKTLLVLAGRKFPLSRDFLGRFLFQGITDNDRGCVFVGIRQLRGSEYLKVPLSRQLQDIEPAAYLPPACEPDPRLLSTGQFISELRRLFIDCVRVRLRSDVPVGVLLSGGIDSSAIAAVAQQLLGYRGFTLLSAVSDHQGYSEEPHIDIMQRHLDMPVEKLRLSFGSGGVMQHLEEASWHNDEPVAGLSVIAHKQIMARAQQLGCKVILSGQGADELLAGYRKFLGFYVFILLRQNRYAAAAWLLTRFAANRSILGQFEWSGARRYVPGLRRCGTPAASAEGPALRGWARLDLNPRTDTLADRQRLDLTDLSVPALCHYEDRMSMAYGREIRLPFLDSRLIDYLLRAPDDLKLRKGWTKWCFRKAMEPFLPPQIAWRRDKQGFTNPQRVWLRNDLRADVEAAFSDDSLIARHGIIEPALMRKKYRQYRESRTGSDTGDREIFAPFSLEIWMRQYKDWIEC